MSRLSLSREAPEIRLYKKCQAVSRSYYVYILSNRRLSAFYVGITNNLSRRIVEHELGSAHSFTSRYRLSRLVYYEEHQDVFEAIVREKRLKRWRRAWKIELIRRENPALLDLAETWKNEFATANILASGAPLNRDPGSSPG